MSQPCANTGGLRELGKPAEVRDGKASTEAGIRTAAPWGEREATAARTRRDGHGRGHLPQHILQVHRLHDLESER